jgi:transposase
VADAAGVALAVYPSTRPGQRPHAVTLVDEAEWQAALAASVLAGPHFRSPILFTGRDGLPDVSREALDTLDPQGAGATHGAAVFAIGRAEAPGGRPAAHAGGKSPALVAASIARLRDRLGGSPAEAIVIASEDNPAFAMPAAAWAARSGDPVLFASRDRLPKATAGALRKNRHAAVFVLGPSSTISSKVVRRIAKIDGHVRRVSGEDPVANAIAFARYRHGSFGWDINDPGHGFVVARSDSPLDAAAAAPLSASGTWGPLLLSDDADTLPGALRAYLLDVKPGYTSDPTRAFYNHVWVIGDQSAISVEQQAEIDSLAELAKIGGKEP